MAQVPTDPWSAGIMGLTSLANSPAPSSQAHMQNSLSFDNSGFVVNVGGGSASSEKIALPSAAAAVAGAGKLLGNPLVIVAVGVALFLYLKHK